MVVLVTGGAGFIGSHVADALLNDGHEVHILDNLSTGRRANVPEQAVLHVHDIRSKEAANLIEAGEFDVLVHHAAQMDVRASVRDPRYDADVNIGGFLNLLEGGRKSGLGKVIFASTGGAIYGEPEYVPQDEDHPQRPLSPYGITKLSAEKYLHFYKYQHNLDFVALRYANVYGPRQNPHGDAGVVAIFTREMLENGDPVVNGSGEQTRDYVFVQDVVRANLGALNYSGSGIFNVGTGRETSVNQLFDTIRDLTDAEIERSHGPAKPGEQQRSVLGYDRIQQEFGWEPAVELHEGLARTVHWFRESDRISA
jgi:UDP-glucose 4-epimerase